MLTQPRNPKGNDVTNHALAFRSLGSHVRNAQRHLSDQAHRSADTFASTQGWTVAQHAGRFGMGARTYRDPRFDARRSAADGVTREPVRLDAAISEWVRALDPARLAGDRLRQAGA